MCYFVGSLLLFRRFRNDICNPWSYTYAHVLRLTVSRLQFIAKRNGRHLETAQLLLGD